MDKQNDPTKNKQNDAVDSENFKSCQVSNFYYYKSKGSKAAHEGN